MNEKHELLAEIKLNFPHLMYQTDSTAYNKD